MKRLSILALTMMALFIPTAPAFADKKEDAVKVDAAKNPVAKPDEKVDSAKPTYMRPQDVQRTSIFAYPGTKCPAASLPYKGVQAKQAEGTGAIYCIVKVEGVYPFMKAYVKDGKCPMPLIPYVDEKLKPDDDAIWCTFPVQGGKNSEAK